MHRAGLAVLALLTLAPSEQPSFVVPDSPDLTIRTQTTLTGAVHWAITLRLKGARQSFERAYDGLATPSVDWHITQCDRRRTVIVNPASRTYADLPIDDPSLSARVEGTVLRHEDGASPRPHITVDAVDTGERKRFGPLTARHVVTTTTTEIPGSPASHITMTQDGWYVDLPPQGCIEWGSTEFMATGFISSTHVVVSSPTITRLGRAKRGFPLSEQIRRVTAEGTSIEKTALVEISDRPIDPAVFEVPDGYRPALRLWGGGFDITRPDTLVNRALLVWEQASGFARRLWQ